MGEEGAGEADARALIVELGPRLYLPALLVHLGEGMLVPTLPLWLRDRSMTYTLVTVIVAAAGVGTIAADIPVGSWLGRHRARSMMLASVATLAVSTVLLAMLTSVPFLVLLRGASGAGMAGWLLARQTYLTRRVAAEARGRVLAVFGGLARTALLAGPVLGGLVATRFGFEASFVVAGLCTAAGMVPLLALTSAGLGGSPQRSAGSIRAVATEHWRRLLSAGSGAWCTVTVRRGRLVLLPLAAAALGMDATAAGALVSIGAVADLLLFPVAGWLMDRFGRLYAIVPAFVMLGVGLLGVAWADDRIELILAATVIGIGNGLGSGTMLTLTSDLAPRHDPGPFLGLISTIRDSGRIAGPVIVGVLADSLGLGASAVVLAVVSFAASLLFVTVVGETLRTGAPAPHTAQYR